MIRAFHHINTSVGPLSGKSRGRQPTKTDTISSLRDEEQK